MRRWHWGKIAILWAWGSMLLAMLLSTFLATRADEHPGRSAFTLLGSLVLLLVLTAITWMWLGGKETDRTVQSAEP